MEVIERLIAAVTKSGIKQIHIARLAQMDKGKLNKILKRHQVPTVLDFIAICRAIKLDPARLFTDGELVIELETLRTAHAASARVHEILGNWLPEVETTPKPPPAVLSFPKPPPRGTFAPVHAAADSNVELLPEIEAAEKQIPRRAQNRGAKIIARAIGDSMTGGDDPIADREPVYVKPTRSIRTANGHVALCRWGEGIYLKKLEKIGHMIRLLSANTDHKRMELDARIANFEIYGIAVDHGPDS